MEPAKAEEVKSPAGQKAKATQETSKPPWSPKLFLEARARNLRNHPRLPPPQKPRSLRSGPKPAPSTQTVTSPVDQKKVTEAPKSPGDAKAPVTAEAKKPTEPAKTEEAKSPAGQKAKTTQEVTKPTRESKAAPAAEPQKPSEAPKPAPSTQATTRLVDQQKPPKFPSRPVTQRPLPPLRRRSQRKRPTAQRRQGPRDPRSP